MRLGLAISGVMVRRTPFILELRLFLSFTLNIIEYHLITVSSCRQNRACLFASCCISVLVIHGLTAESTCRLQGLLTTQVAKDISKVVDDHLMKSRQQPVKTRLQSFVRTSFFGGLFSGYLFVDIFLG